MEKIAFPTEDGKTISQHFGRAPLFVVVALDGKGSAQYEQRSKGFHGEQHEPGHSHNSMFEPIEDCQVLIAGGMGQPAYDHAAAAGLKIIMTGEKTITTAVEAYQAGRLASDPRRVHQPH
jgi:predicted Fe-Mo cluster-binding NifX family protein